MSISVRRELAAEVIPTKDEVEHMKMHASEVDPKQIQDAFCFVRFQ
jgi:hypothetical protein